MFLHGFLQGIRGPLLFEDVGYTIAALLVLAMVRIWIFYKFQVRAIELVAPLIRRAKCRQLYGDGGSAPFFRLSFRDDLRMIFDLSKWRFQDFYPNLEQEESW